MTHSKFDTTLAMDLLATTTKLPTFLPPLSRWMERPAEDRDLGHKILAWMKQEYNHLF